MDSCRFSFNSGVNSAYQDCINHFITILVKQQEKLINILNYLRYIPDILFRLPSYFLFLIFFPSDFPPTLKTLDQFFFPFILYSYFEYWCWPCSHYNHPCMFFSVPHVFSSSHFGCPIEYLESF